MQGNDDVFCYIPINERFLSIYYSRAVLPPLEVSSYFYRYIPRLYGLMDLFVPEALDRNFDPQPLIRSGISFVQKEPLNLTGRECCPWICGYGNRLPESCFPDGRTEAQEYWPSGTKVCRPAHLRMALFMEVEYTREQINEALQLDNPLELVPVTDDIGHGTATASAAAGSALNGGIDFLGQRRMRILWWLSWKQAKQFLRDYYMTPPGVPALWDQRYHACGKIPRVPSASPFIVRRLSAWGGEQLRDHTGNSAVPVHFHRWDTD